uniref:phage tail tape measure protein n=1 Tax=Acetatifactor aquisgranensis TaxID=2941233 RepID=UPI00203E71E2
MARKGGNNIQGITIEIGGDATKLEKALSGVEGKVKSTQAELKEVEKLLKLDPKNTEALAQKQQLLSKAISETKEKLDVLKTAEAQVEEQFKRGEVSEEQYRALKREIEATEQSLKRLEEEARQSNITLEKVGNAFGKIGETSTNLGKKMLPVTTAITGAGVAAGTMASSFEDAMAKVSTIADETEVPIEDLEAAILNLSDETGIAATDIADNVYNAISAGQSTGDAVNFVSNATKLAKAGFAESGDALDILTTIMNAYGMEAEKVTD